MYSFKELKKASKIKIEEGEVNRVVVLGNCATQFFSTAILGCAKLNGLNISLLDTDYNQIEAQVLDKESEMYKYQPDEVILWLATDKLYEEFLDSDFKSKLDFAEVILSRLEYYWDQIDKNCGARILQPNFTVIDDKILGQYSCKVENTFIYQIRKLNFLLQEAMRNRKNVFPVDILAIQTYMGTKQFYDASLYYNAKMTVSLDALPYVANAVVDVLKAMQGHIKKCLIMDLDNTLWGGVIGDDGLGGIEIGELGRGHAFLNLQRWIKQLKECGIILAVCSKNDEENAKLPFTSHDEMILHLSDISIFVANWNDKASNIKYIQESLNIGMDSIVFIDDNPFERNLVRSMIPDIEVPELPDDPALYLEYLQEMNYFDTIAYTGENADRTKQYKAEFERKKLQTQYESIEEYLLSLEMVGVAKPFDSVRFSRIAQLTQRSNQFNLRTIRYTEDEIERIANDNQYLTLYFMLKDKFGDHGLVSVVIMKKISENELFVDTWLMSCRVLKRGMEEFIINKIVETAKENGFDKIYSEYIRTNKNSMVSNIYNTMGFEEYDDKKYFVSVKEFVKRKTYIKEEM